MAYRIGICDNEQNIVLILTGYIEHYFQLQGEDVEIHTWNSGEELISDKVFGTGEGVDILFLDIELPDMNGVSIGRYIRNMVSKALAAEWAKNNITVNVLGPGYFASEMSAKVANEVYEASIRNNCPMGRRGNPGELNGAMLFLASDASSYVTGQLLLVDGGWTIV